MHELSVAGRKYMLTNLHVRNLALIDETEINFKDGLNILTGETGAGKSIILGSINIALGNKASSDVIRKGAEYALTELTFHIEEPEKIAALKALDIEELEEGDIIISRKIMPTRSQIKINGQTFTAGEAKEITSMLIDIHGQHDSQLLLNENRHLDIVDQFLSEEIEPLKRDIKDEYHRFIEVKKRLQSMGGDEEKRNREISLLEYEINEIEAARLLPEEDVQLEQDYKRMSNAKKIIEQMSSADHYITSGDENACNLVSSAIRAMSSALPYDTDIQPIYDALSDVESLVSDVSRMITDYTEDCAFDEEDFIQTEKRLDLINSLKMKYGKTIPDILAYQEQQQKRLLELSDYEANLAKLQAEASKVEKQLETLSSQLSVLRKQSAKKLCAYIEGALKDLNFNDVIFTVEFNHTSSYTANGFDTMRFMISTNPGEDVKPLSRIASGGELSRIMLAIKTVIAGQDDIETLIFDEIDAGISGRTAQMVANKLSVLSRTHQIICITHLPQIAAMADTHFLIEKSSTKDTTTTYIHELNDSQCIAELARLLGGAVISEAVLNNAREMKTLANDSKN
jgi:DNA repair protein RecN (Recombination protein N)